MKHPSDKVISEFSLSHVEIDKYQWGLHENITSTAINPA